MVELVYRAVAMLAVSIASHPPAKKAVNNTGVTLSGFAVVGSNTAVLLRDRNLLLVDLDSGCLRTLGTADRVAVDRTHGTILAARWLTGGTDLVLMKVTKCGAQPLARRKIGLIAACLGPAYWGDYRFYVLWCTPKVGKDASARGLMLIRLVSQIDQHLLLDPVPPASSVMSVFASSSILFCPARPYTFAMSGYLSPAAIPVIAKQVRINKEEIGAHMVLVVDGKLSWVFSVPGAASNRPIKFSQDGKRLLARILYPPGVYREFGIINLQTGQIQRSCWLPDGCQVLAVSDDLATAIVREDWLSGVDVICLVRSADFTEKFITTVNDLDSVMADFANGNFFVTDGRMLWRVSGNGNIREIRLKGCSN